MLTRAGLGLRFDCVGCASLVKFESLLAVSTSTVERRGDGQGAFFVASGINDGS